MPRWPDQARHMMVYHRCFFNAILPLSQNPEKLPLQMPSAGLLGPDLVFAFDL